MAVANRLLTETLRPKSLKTIILLDRVRKALGENPLSQHLLLSGHRGCGKSSLATILSQGLPTIKINASSARGIDTVRDVIVPHCSTLSFTQSVDENLKLVFLDEFDNATRDFYDAMRGTIEQYSDNARFIATCNYSNKITPEVRDRFLELNFSPQNKEEEVELFNKYKDRITKLSPRINIEWESDEVLDKFISNMFPSFRKMISSLQSFMDSGTTLVTNSDVNRATYSFIDLYKMIVSKSDPYKIYQFIMTDYQNKVDEVLTSLGDEFPKWVKENEPSKSSLIGAACIYSAEWQWKKTMLVDPVQALNACIFQINSIFSK